MIKRRIFGVETSGTSSASACLRQKSFVGLAAACVLLALAPSVLRAATSCANPPVRIASNLAQLPPPPQNPSNVVLLSWLTMGRRAPVLYSNTKYGVMGVYLGTNPGDPTPTFTPMSFRAGGPVGGGTLIDCWPGPSNMAVADSDSGAGRLVTGWNDGSGCGEPEQLMAVNSPGDQLIYGQQIDVSGSSKAVSPSAIAAALTSSGSYAGYFTDAKATYVVNVTNPAFNVRATPLGAFQTLTAWANATRFTVLGGAGHDSYLAAVLSTSVQIASIGGDGRLTVLSTTAALSSSPASGGAAEQMVSYPSGNGYFIFVAVSGGIDVLFFDGTNLTRKGLIANVGTNKYSRVQVPVGAPSPIVLAEKGFPPDIDVYSGGFLTGNVGAPTLATTIPAVANDSLAGFGAFVDSSDPKTLYTYRPVASTNLYLQTDTFDISCISSPPSPNPTAFFSLVNKSTQTRADQASYVGDTFSLADNSAAGTGGAITNWYLWSGYSSSTSNKGNADVSTTSAPSLATLVLPCTNGISGGQCSYAPASIQGASVSETFGELVSAGNLDSLVFTRAITLTVPATKVAGRGSDGSVKLLSGGTIDASGSTGSPTGFVWAFHDASSAVLSTSCAAATCTPPALSSTYSVSAHYAGGYASPAVSGTVVFTDVAGSITTPPTAYSGQGTIPVTIDLLKGSSVTILDIDYAIDGAVPASLSKTVTKTSTTYKGTGSILIPAGLSVGKNHTLNFIVHYSGGSIGTSVAFPTTFFYSAVQYSPLIWISKSQSSTATDTCFVSVFQGAIAVCGGAPGTFFLSDTGDSGKPALSATWDFGDGSPVDSAHLTTDFVSHSFSGGTFSVKLTVGATTVTQQFSLTAAALQASIGGPSTLSAGASGTWSANVSGGTPPYTYAWTSTNGGSGSGATFSRTFAASGSVSLTVHDAASGVAHPTKAVSVPVSGSCNGAVNTFCVSGNPSVVQGTPASWTASVSGVPSSSLYVDWSITGPGLSAHASGITLSYTFPQAGTFVLTATGGALVGSVPVPLTSGSKTVTVTSSGIGLCGTQPCPTAVFDITGAQFSPYTGTYSGKAGDVLTFTGAETLNTPFFAWKFGDGSEASGKVVTHSFSSHGNFSVKLNVTNTVGSATAQKSVSIEGDAFSAFFVPGAGHLVKDDGGAFATELSLFNNSETPVSISLDFEKLDPAANVDPSKLSYPSGGQFVILPHQGWTQRDVTSEFLGGGPSDFGTLFIKYSGPAPSALARIYFSAGAGAPTYGTYLPTYPFGGSGQSLGGISSEIQNIAGLKFDDQFTGGLTLVSASPTGGSFDVSLFRDDGTTAGQTLHLTISGFQQAKLHGSDFSIVSDPGHIYFAVVKPTDASPAPSVAIGTVTDNRTHDSLLLVDDTPRQTSAPGTPATYYVAGVGRTDGGARTDLYLLNSSEAGPIGVTYTMHYVDAVGEQTVTSQTSQFAVVGTHQAVQISDVITTLFPSITGAVVGDLRIDYQVPNDSAPLIFEGRNYTDTGAGSYGMQLPAFSAADGLVPGSASRIVLAGLHNDLNTTSGDFDYISRFGFVALGDTPVQVHADAYDQADGTLFWSGSYSLNTQGGFGHFVYLPTTGIYAPPQFASHGAFNLVISSTGTGTTPVGAFATVQDTHSKDLVFVPGKAPANAQ